MAIGFGEHDVRAHKISVAGIPIEGFADDVITITPTSDHRTTTTGADGHVVSAKNADEGATVKLSIMRNTASSRALWALVALDRAALGGAGVGAFEMRDVINGQVESSERCWIQARPEVTIGKEAPTEEWTLRLAKWRTTVPA